MNYKVFLVGFIIIVMVLTVTLIISLYYRKPCEGKSIFFVVYGASENDNLKIHLNDNLEYERTFSKDYGVPIHSSEAMAIANYCVKEDSVKVRFSINQMDTTFYINPDSIRGTFFATRLDTIGFVVFHNYYVGSLRENTPQDWQ